LERRQAAGRVWGVVITFLGVVLSFPVLFGRDLEWNKIWPLFVIGWGLALLWGALESRRTRPAIGSDLDSLNQWTIFGGGELQVSSRQFQGGELFAMFGGWNVDLRHADIKDSEATVEVNTICGGATLRVPEGWKVILKGAAIMGGFSDKSRPPRPEDDATAKRLYIRGTALCGGVEIKN
jgi:hypothetical protein